MSRLATLSALIAESGLYRLAYNCQRNAIPSMPAAVLPLVLRCLYLVLGLTSYPSWLKGSWSLSLNHRRPVLSYYCSMLFALTPLPATPSTLRF